MSKPTKWLVRPVKTLISLGIRPVWSVFTVRMNKAWVLSYPLSAQRRLIRLGGCLGLSESSLGTQVILLVLSCTGRSVFDVCFRGSQWQKLSTGGQQRLWLDWDACSGWMPRQICVFAGHKSHLSQCMTKPTKRTCLSESSLVWSESSLSAWIKLRSLATHWEHSEDWSYWAGMPRQIRVFASLIRVFAVHMNKA